MKKKSNIGVIGLGTMGAAIARNLENKGLAVSVFNRSSDKLKDFKSKHKGEFQYYKQIKSFVDSLEKPRKILLMVSPDAVDTVIESLKKHLQKGDLIMDGGNSYYEDTTRRLEDMKAKKLNFLGLGISGGEKGALEGPSIMVGGQFEAWELVSGILDKIAAKDFEGKSCVSYLGESGSGHMVKMVHNGIEYAIMQMIAEAFSLFKAGYGLSPVMISEIFRRYNEGRLESYLLEICEPILKEVDYESGKALVEVILDKAGQKGTGRWTARDAIDFGVESSTLTQAVHARVSSSKKEKRVKLEKKYNLWSDKQNLSLALEQIIPKVEQALFCNWIVIMEQGLEMIKAISDEKNWKINVKEVTRVWQGGCIIRAKLLIEIGKHYTNDSLLESKWAQVNLKNGVQDWRCVLKTCLEADVPLYCLNTGYNSLQSTTQGMSSANMIQAMRDYFGAHTFQRVDKNANEVFHHQWKL